MMTRILLAFALLLLGFTRSFGQDVAELTILRSLLGVPQNTPVKSSSSVPVPKDKPFKLYLDVSGDSLERDKKVKDSLAQWLNEWGKSNNATGMSFELAAEPGDASVALIHFTDFPTEIVDPNASRGDEIGSPSSQGSGGSSFSSTIKMSMTVYTYIIIRESNSLKIVYRRKDPSVTRSTIVAGAYLTKTATDRLRKEIDTEIEKRNLKARGEKDSERPDIRLRDEFAKWVTSKDGVLKSQ